MPRKAPKEVIEHRITLGDFERKELKDAINSYQSDKVLENIPNIMIGTAGVVVAGTVAFVGYALYYWLDSVPNPITWLRGAVTGPSDAVRQAAMTVVNANQYARFKTIDEVNAAWDTIAEERQQDIAKATRFIAAYEEGKIGIFAPDWLVKFYRGVIANEAQTMANLAVERAEYIEAWTAYWAERNASEEQEN